MKAPPTIGSILGDTPFLWTITFDESGAGALAPLGSAPEFAPGRLVWAHINVADLRGRRWIEAREEIPEDARELLVGPATGQRLHALGDSLWGAIVDYAQDFGRDIDEDAPSAADLTQLRFAAGPGYVITTRRRPSRSAAAVRHAVLRGKTVADAFELVNAIADQSMEALDRAIDLLGDDLNEVEDRVLGDDIRDERRRLGVLRRALIRVHREINGALRVVSRFDTAGVGSSEARAVVQRLAMRLDACNQEVHAAEQRARLLQDEIVSKLTTETNRQLYVLTILGTLLMPPTLVSGLFGMNVKGLPFTDEPGTGFFYALGVSVSSALLAWALMWGMARRPAASAGQLEFRRKRKEKPPPSEEG
ncbi:MAG: magnesium transporter CorA [Methylocystis sp.]|nr:magnesium transporter CorA [Methylocystis sp.]